jgi:hypothetical protein
MALPAGRHGVDPLLMQGKINPETVQLGEEAD